MFFANPYHKIINNMDKIISLCLMILALTTLSGCKKTAQKNSIPPLNVEVARAEARLLSDKIWFTTTTEPHYSVTIEPRVNGYLEEVRYKSGAPIKSGESIFQIEPSLLNTTYYSALATVESARASLVEAENNYKRAIPLAKIDAISRTSLDEYTANYAAAKSNLKSAEESLKSAKLNLSYTTITAPIDGLIAESPASLGDYVGPGTSFATLTTISYVDTLKLALAIPTAKYLKHTNQKASYDNRDLLSDIILILADSSIYKDRATYDYTQKDISSGSSTVVIYAKVPNTEGQLKPNMFTRVCANIGNESEKIMIPQKAVTQMQGISSVWVIGKDSTASYRVVKVGSTYGTDWHIVSGLKAGEMVATSAQLKIHEGERVIPSIKTDKK